MFKCYLHELQGLVYRCLTCIVNTICVSCRL